MRKIPVPTLLTASIVVAIMLVYAITFEVRFSEAVVKVRLGKAEPEDVITEPGLRLKWPYPIEELKRYDVRLRTLDTLEGEISMRDGKNVVVGNYAIWRIKEPLKFMVAVKTVKKAEEELRARINQRRAAVIGSEDLSAFANLNEEQVRASYERIENALLNGKDLDSEDDRSLKEQALDDYGIELVRVDIRRVSLPEDTTQSVFQQMVAERQKVAARFREEGKSQAQTITAQAEAANQKILAFARTKAAEMRSQGIRASKRVLEQIAAEDVEFFEWLRWLDALRVSLRQRSTIFLDNNSALFDKFVEPPAMLAPAPLAPEE
ncbi:MAG: protease modulator HflC [Planctomycetota bacterium]